MAHPEFRSLFFLLFFAPCLLAMGGGGAGPLSDTIPRPKDNYGADLVDRQGVSTRVDYLSCNGKTFFPLERGEGTLMVPFSKVLRLEVAEEAGARVKVSIEASGGKALDGSLPRALLCTGSTDYGNYQIELQGLREIRLQGGQ
jgi:hypothetical protein